MGKRQRQRDRAIRSLEAEEPTVEGIDRVPGRVIEAKGTDAAGGRVFRVQVLETGKLGKNGRRYPEAVVRAAAALYEGAKAYDHHRTDDELRTSTIAGLVGSYRAVESTATGLEADLHLLPGATHTAEALDASLAAQAAGLAPLVGISHDVHGTWRAVVEGGQRFQEATRILKVNSADVVADPAAGGRVTRMVAGGSDEPNPEEGHMKTLKEVLALLRAAKTRADYDALATEHKAVLDVAGLSAADDAPFVEPVVEPVVEKPKELVPAGAPAGAGAGAGEQVTESTYARSSIMGDTLLRAAIGRVGFTGDDVVGRVAEAVTPILPERFTETDLTTWLKDMKPNLEKLFLGPSVPHVQVVKEARDRQIEALNATFDGDFSKGYSSIRQAFFDISGADPRKFFSLGSGDINRAILRESYGQGWDSGQRMLESLDTTSWAEVLGDSITRRLIKEYQLPQLQSWRRLVSDIVPVNDFRSQHRVRVGGYGVLPVVNQGAPYQPLTSPGDEEVTYALEKRGGTEDLTIEMIANDDIGALARIPRALGRAAAQTLYRFVWDFLKSNALIYDSVALFAAGHANTTNPRALNQANLTAAGTDMMTQTAYGDSTEILEITPSLLVVPPALREMAFQLTNSAVAIPASGNASNIPNINQTITPLVVPYLTDTDDWFLVADPAMIPTIELGFYQGRQEPELFTQADPTVGAVFTADKITWKIRFIFKGAVLDYRGFQRGQGS